MKEATAEQAGRSRQLLAGLSRQVLKRWEPFHAFLDLYLGHPVRALIRQVIVILGKWRLTDYLKSIIEFSTRLRYSSAAAWTATTFLGLATCAFSVSILAYGFAHSGQGWFIHLWDNVVLKLYATFHFHHNWWIVIPVAITLIVLVARPWQLYRCGNWRMRRQGFVWRYALLFTAYSAFLWLLHSYLLNVSWLFALGLGFVCHFLAMLTLGVFNCLVNRCPPLNLNYIEQTREIILKGHEQVDRSQLGRPWKSNVIDQVFQSSFYGFLVQQMAGSLFDILVGRWVVGLFMVGSCGINRLNRMRGLFVRFLLHVSFARLFDWLLTERYYVMHFEMVLRDLLLAERKLAWETMSEALLPAALLKHAIPGIFIKDSSEYPNLATEKTSCGIQEKLDRFCYLKLLTAEYLTTTAESSSLWGALGEMDALIDYLDLCHELSLMGGEGPQEDLSWLDQGGIVVRKARDEIAAKLREQLRDPQRLDPRMRGHTREISLLLDFVCHLNTIPIADRKDAFLDQVPYFEEVRHGIPFSPLDSLLKEAREEMESLFALQPQTFYNMLPRLTFADRPELQDMGIFRIRQELRHLVFSANPVPANLLNQIYCMPALDEYLLCRDLRGKLLRRWGRFTPLVYNHFLIKYYNEPQYWQNQHCFLSDIDQLRLGLALYQYAMELRENNMITRMIYRQALDCFNKATVFLPEALRLRLWGI